MVIYRPPFLLVEYIKRIELLCFQVLFRARMNGSWLFLGIGVNTSQILRLCCRRAYQLASAASTPHSPYTYADTYWITNNWDGHGWTVPCYGVLLCACIHTYRNTTCNLLGGGWDTSLAHTWLRILSFIFIVEFLQFPVCIIKISLICMQSKVMIICCDRFDLLRQFVWSYSFSLWD